MDAVCSGRWSAVAGDVMLLDVPGFNVKRIPLPHPAVSGRLGWNGVPRYCSAGETLLEVFS